MVAVNIDPVTGLPYENNGYDDGVGTPPGTDPGDGPILPPTVGGGTAPITDPIMDIPTSTPPGTIPPVGTPVLPGIDAPVGEIDPITGQPLAVAETAAPVDEGNLAGVPIGPTGAVTREVQDEELVANQLEGLLSGDSSYIRNARQRAAELSNRRGQFTSNLFAGASERAAIESALPIAQADAQGFRDAASQNLVARNQNAIANIQRAAQLDTALLSSRTSISLANLDASTRVGIANMDTLARINIANLDAGTQVEITNMNNAMQALITENQNRLQLIMQTRNMNHDAAMETFRQEGRVELANMDAALQTKLAQAGFTHDINMQGLNAASAEKLNTVIQEYGLESQARDHEVNNRQSHINMAMQAQINYVNLLASFAGTEMDDVAAAALNDNAWFQLVGTYTMINGLYPNQPAIIPTRDDEEEEGG